MSATASSTIDISASPQEVLEFVLDLKRYKEVDRKFLRVGKVVGPDAEGRGSVSLWGRVKGFPPAPDRQDFQLVPWSRLTFTGASRQPGRLIFDFTGSFACKASTEGVTEVTHSYEFSFKGPFRRVEKKLALWLQQEIDLEMKNLAAALTKQK